MTGNSYHSTDNYNGTTSNTNWTTTKDNDKSSANSCDTHTDSFCSNLRPRGQIKSQVILITTSLVDLYYSISEPINGLFILTVATELVHFHKPSDSSSVPPVQI